MIAETSRSLLLAALAAAWMVPAWSAEEATSAEPTSEEREADSSAAQERPRVEDVEYVEVNVRSLPTSNTITTKLAVPLLLTPANVGTVSAPLIEEQNDLVLGDALRNVSGVNIQPGSGGVYDYFLIRGFDSENGSLVMIDGVAEPEAGFYRLYNVQGIEVLKGPGGFLYGKDPLAGTVNIIRKQPLPTDLGTIAGTLGSHGTSELTTDWNVSSTGGDVAFRVNSLWHDSDGYRDGRTRRHVAVNPSLTWRPTENSTLNFNVEYADAEYAPDSGIPLLDGAIPDVPRRRSYQSPFDFSQQEITRVQVDFETRLRDGLSLRNKTYYRELDWQTQGTLFSGTGVPPSPFGPGCPGTEVCRNLTLLDDRQQYFGNQFEVVSSFDTGSVKHSLLAGVELARLVDDYALDVALLPGIDIFDPVETALPQYVVPFPLQTGDSTTTIIAPYVIDQMRLSGKFNLLLGVRYDDIEFEDDLSGVPSRDDSGLSPMAGLVFSPVEDLSLYASWGRAFAPAGPRVVDPDRQPEESVQSELGVKRKFLDGRAQVTFALYQIDRENIPITDDSGFLQQAGDQRSRGIELELAAEPLPRLHTFLSYAYNEAELTRFTERIATGPLPEDFIVVDRSGNTPAFAPKHLFNFWVSRSFGFGLSLGGGARFVGEQYIAEDNGFKIDGAVVVDAMAAYDLRKVRFKLDIRNLLDNEYETRGFRSYSVTPAEPITFFLGVEFKL